VKTLLDELLGSKTLFTGMGIYGAIEVDELGEL